MCELRALLHIIKSRQIIIVTFFIATVAYECALGFFIFSDSLAKQFEAFVGVALVLTLIQIDPGVSLKFFLNSYEIFLCMRADLSPRA